jgi:nucleoside-diphosphate kinase
LTAGEVTCAVVRPHAVKAGSLPAILDAILSSRSFTVTAMKMCALAKADAAEFLEVYDGVMPTHKDMLVELCTGPAVALEVRFSGQQRSGGGGVVEAFRAFVGPWDVEMAKELRPDTIRAKHGVDRTKNAIHATDLPEDGVAECGYLFDFLQ